MMEKLFRELSKAKYECEEKIHGAVIDFEANTGLRVVGIELKRQNVCSRWNVCITISAEI